MLHFLIRGKELYGKGAIRPQEERGYGEMVIINAQFHHREMLGHARGNVEDSRPPGVDPCQRGMDSDMYLHGEIE